MYFSSAPVSVWWKYCLLHLILLRIRRAFLAFSDVTVHSTHVVYFATTINDYTYGIFTEVAITSEYIPSKTKVFNK
jgi:hypothetical protein